MPEKNRALSIKRCQRKKRVCFDAESSAQTRFKRQRADRADRPAKRRTDSVRRSDFHFGIRRSCKTQIYCRRSTASLWGKRSNRSGAAAFLQPGISIIKLRHSTRKQANSTGPRRTFPNGGSDTFSGTGELTGKSAREITGSSSRWCSVKTATSAY